MLKVAITGTNGKTSTVTLAYQLMSACGFKTASLGTLGLISKDYSDSSPLLIGNTAVSELANELEDIYKVEVLIFEAFSSCIEGRMYDNLDIDLAILTNIGTDYLDFHGTKRNYIQAKLRLFKEVIKPKSQVIFNYDDQYSQQLIGICKQRKMNFFSFGRGEKADLQLKSFYNYNNLSKVVVRYNNQVYSKEIPIVGEIFIQNWLCAMSIALVQGVEIEQLLDASYHLALPEGRLEKIGSLKGATIYVDYAHNADALKAVLKVLRSQTKGGLYLVFGCGGNREKDKRKTMGEIANIYADNIYITDDNPREESTEEIRLDVLKYCKNGINCGDRKQAIYMALNSLKAEDILLVAGKGHEKHQEVKGKKISFSDKEIILEFLNYKMRGK